MKPAIKVVLPMLLAAAALSAVYVIKNRVPFEERKPAVGDMAPEIALADLSGGMISLSDYGGKVVLVNFWATWCPPCREEMPFFQGAFDAYGDQGLQIVAIALDDVTPDLVRQLGITFPVARTNPRVTKAYGDIGDVPVSFLIGRDGRIVRKMKGFYPADTLTKNIEEALVKK